MPPLNKTPKKPRAKTGKTKKSGATAARAPGAVASPSNTKTAPPAPAHSHGFPALPDKMDIADPISLGRIMSEVADRARPVLKSFFDRRIQEFNEQPFDPLNLRKAYLEFSAALISNPAKLAGLQLDYWQQWYNLVHQSTLHFLGAPHNEPFPSDKGDRRFRADDWHESAVFDFIRQSYLLTSRWTRKLVSAADGLDRPTQEKVDFYTRQFMDALSPSNFLLTNPEVLRETFDSHGENLVRGLENLLEDLERGKGDLKISTTDYDAFKLGKNIAVTPGKVVYQNDLMQMIQYTPTTKTVRAVPLLIVPPWINKYYILDLRPDNSFVRWIVDQGYTVFIISWVNPDAHLARKRFEDYMEEGVLDARTVIGEITGEKDCNIVGYCLGGTLLAITLAALALRKGLQNINSATFLTTLLDFEQAGELKLFTDDEQLALLDREMAEKGVLEARSLQRTFSLLRANDLIWSFVVNNYLMGKEPFPFDLLYWNDDSTNMPAAMHSFYLRKMYRDNLLTVPGGIRMNDVPIDISKIDIPTYFLSTREDHIAPWKATYSGAHILGGKDKTFTLAASGHIAGVVNPPAQKKYCYWTSSDLPDDPDSWLHSAEEQTGSWWPHWEQWLRQRSGKEIPARQPGSKTHPPIEDAPGKYVNVKR